MHFFVKFVSEKFYERRVEINENNGQNPLTLSATHFEALFATGGGGGGLRGPDPQNLS